MSPIPPVAMPVVIEFYSVFALLSRGGNGLWTSEMSNRSAQATGNTETKILKMSNNKGHCGACIVGGPSSKIF